MKKITRIFALLLAVLTVCGLVGCANSSTPADSTAAQTTASANQSQDPGSTTAVEDTAIQPNLSTKKFDREFVIASGYVTETKYTSNLIISDETNGEQINDAVFSRTVLLEEQYNITMVVNDMAPSKVVTSYKSGERIADVGTATLSEMTNVLQNGAAYDLREVDAIELEKPWWDQNANAKFATADKLYYTFSDFFITGIDNCRACYFNKTMADDLNLGDLYKIAKDGDWTVDLFHEMCLKALSDVDGNGQYDENDHVGVAEAATQYYEVLLTSCNMEVVQQGKNNIPFYSPHDNSVQFTEVYLKLLNLFSKDNSYLNIKNTPAEQMFANGNSLFILYTLSFCPKTRKNSEVDFGIMPCPKYTAEQKDYLHVSPNGDAIFIVAGNKEEVEFAGAILEAASYYSSNYYSDKALMPSYFDLCLATKNAPDLESSENLQLIHDSISYTMKVLGTDYMQSIYDAFGRNDFDIASIIKSCDKQYVKKIATSMAALGIDVNK